MSRANYSDCLDSTELNLWRGAVESAIRGKRGQAILREMLAAFDAMPVKELIAHDLERADGAVCALGCVGKKRGLDMSRLDPEDSENIAKAFGISDALTREIEFENDEHRKWDGYGERSREETPSERWTRMRAWVAAQIKPL